MVLNLSDLGPRSCCEIRDLPAPNSNNEQDEIGYISRKKYQYHPRTEEDGGDDHELARKKKVRTSNIDTEADASSSESDHSCFVAFVKASNLQKDALYLPQDLTNSVGLKRKCSEIVITDEREKSWPMDLRFNKSSDTFYISRGWRSFCHENGKKAGGIFVFKLVGNRKTPVLSFCSTESFNHGTRDKNNEDNCMELESKKKRMRCRDSTSPSLNRFLKVTLTHYSLTNSRQHLPLPFTRENGLVKPGIINLLGKDGTKWKANLKREADGRMSLGKGWKDFAKENGLNIGEFFKLEVIWENGTLMLSFYSTESINDGTKGDKNNKENRMELKSKKKRMRWSPSQNRFVKLTLTHDSLRNGRLGLPLPFMRENGLLKPRIINLLGKDGTKWNANLLREATGRMRLGKGWIDFAKANGLNIDDSFTLEAISENGTPMLSLFSLESTSINVQQRECSKDSEKDSKSTKPSGGNKTRKATNNKEEKRDSSSAIKNQFVTLTLTPEDVRDCKLYLPQDLTNSVGLTSKCSEIVIKDERERSWPMDLRFNKSSNTFYISRGWRSFCDENGKKAGGIFVFKLVGNRKTPVLSFCSTESFNDGTEGDKNNKENCLELKSTKKRMRWSPSQNRFLKVTLTHDSLRKYRLHLPMSFVRENGLLKPGIINLLGKDGTKWDANLRQDVDGKMSLGKGWKDFAKANGLNIGDSFTLEAISENGTPMLSLFSLEPTSINMQQRECSKDSENDSKSTEPSGGNKTRKATNNKEEKRDSSSALKSQFVTLTLTPEDVRDCKLILPSEFMKANGIKKLGKITLLGQNRMKWFGYLLTKDRIVALGCGWKGFCEANGVKTGESFTLECINEQDTTYVFKFCSNSLE